jgi:predicted nuclease of predicted toxin-antitoxin system
MMRFLLDSCISGFAVKDLTDVGFEVIWIPKIGKDPGDESILKKAFDEDLILVTADKDFGELVFVFDKPHPSIIRLVDMPAKDQGKVLLQLIKTHREDIERKALITVERYRVRIRL